MTDNRPHTEILTVPAQASVGFAREPFQKRGGEPRFADAGLAG